MCGCSMKRPEESQTEYSIRLIRQEAWEQGYQARRDEEKDPNGPGASNPYA